VNAERVAYLQISLEGNLVTISVVEVDVADNGETP
jgi:hypothetical protein